MPTPTRAPTIPEVGVEVTKVDQHDPIIAGWKQRYMITVANRGSEKLGFVTVRDSLPPGCDPLLEESTDGASATDGIVTWRLNELPAGDKLDIELIVHVHSTHPHGAILTNCVEVTARTVESASVCEDTMVVHEGLPVPTRRPTSSPTGTAIVRPTSTLTKAARVRVYLPLMLKPASAVPLSIRVDARDGPIRARR